MKAQNERWINRACKARAELEARFLHLPEVSMIDFGIDEAGSEAIVLRLHLRRREAVLAGLPQELEGIPVRVIYGNYELQNE